MELLLKDQNQIEVMKKVIGKISSSKLPGNKLNITISKDDKDYFLNYTLDTVIRIHEDELNDSEITKGIFYSIGYILKPKAENTTSTYEILNSMVLDAEAMGPIDQQVKKTYLSINKNELEEFSYNWNQIFGVKEFSVKLFFDNKKKLCSLIFNIKNKDEMNSLSNFDFEEMTFLNYECNLNPFVYPVNEMLQSSFFKKEDLNYSVFQELELNISQIKSLKSLINTLGDFTLELELANDNLGNKLIVFKARNKRNKGYDTVFIIKDSITMKGKFKIPRDQLNLLKIYFGQLETCTKINKLENDKKTQENEGTFILEPLYASLKFICINSFNNPSIWLHFNIKYTNSLLDKKEVITSNVVMKQEFMINMNLDNDE